MNFTELADIIETARREHPGWFELPPDGVATELTLKAAEKQLGLALPQEYRQFVLNYGGGDFAFMNVFSVDPDGYWNILQRNRTAGLPDGNFLGISDDETGGLYGFCIRRGALEPEISHLDLSAGEIVRTEFKNVFELIAGRGLSHSGMGRQS